MSPDPDVHTTLDNEAFSILRKANPGSNFYVLWVREFDRGDEKWRQRLWRNAPRNPPSNVENLEPFLAWAERRLSKAPTGNTPDLDTVQAADTLRSLTAVHSGPVDPILAERVFTALKTSQHLNAEWWLSQPLVYRSSNSEGPRDTNLWSPAMKSEITRVAIETMENAKASPTLVAQACMILANGAELNPRQRTVVLTSTSNRLTAACATPDALTSMVPIGDAFGQFSGPEIVPGNSFSAVRVQIDVHNRASACASCPVLDMLTLVGKLDGAAAVQPQLDLVLNETHDTLELINSQHAKLLEANRSRNGNTNGFGRGSSPFIVALAWPKLADSDAGMSRGNNTALAGVPDTGPLATVQLWGTHKPTAHDWLKYLILLHPTMKETVDAALTKIQPADANIPSDVSTSNRKPAQPVYGGKTLPQWLEVIQTERSPEEFVAALKACSALTTPETSARITETLLKVLPTWPEDAAVGQPGSWTKIDDESFGLLAKANPGRKYYALLVIEYGSQDAKLRKRLAPQIPRGDYEKFESVEPLLAWAQRTVLDSNTKTISLQDLNDAASFLTTFIGKFPDNKAFVDSAVAALVACKALQPEWWMARLVAFRDVDRKYIRYAPRRWPAALHAAVASRAIAVLEDPMAAENLVAQALMILSNVEDLTPDQKTKILTAVNQRLIKAAHSPELLVHMIDVDPSFEILTFPHQKPATEDGVNSHSPKQISWDFSTTYANAKASITLELLDLFQALQAESPPTEGLEAIATALADVESLDFELFKYSGSWPSLAVREVPIVRSRSNSPPKRSLQGQPPSEILKIVLHEHPALKKYREQQAAQNPPETKTEK